MSIASITFTNALIEAENIAKSTKLFCLECPTRSTCKKICKELEKELPKERSGGHRKEFSVGVVFDPLDMHNSRKQLQEEIQDKEVEEAISDKINKRICKGKHRVKYNDNWEAE